MPLNIQKLPSHITGVTLLISLFSPSLLTWPLFFSCPEGKLITNYLGGLIKASRKNNWFSAASENPPLKNRDCWQLAWIRLHKNVLIGFRQLNCPLRFPVGYTTSGNVNLLMGGSHFEKGKQINWKTKKKNNKMLSMNDTCTYSRAVNLGVVIARKNSWTTLRAALKV